MKFPRFQFRLRTLLGLILVLAAPCAWLGSHLQQFRQQSRAIAELEKSCLVAVSGKAEWNDFGRPRIESVDLYGPVSAGDIERVSQLPFLTRLGLNDCLVSDEAWSALGRLERLQSLAIAYTDMSDEQLLCLTGLSRLRELSLTSTGVTDAGVSELERALPELSVSDD